MQRLRWFGFCAQVLAPVSFATILGCSHCTIVVSAVSGSVLIEHCEDVRVIVAASTVRVRCVVPMARSCCAAAQPRLLACAAIPWTACCTCTPLLDRWCRVTAVACCSRLTTHRTLLCAPTCCVAGLLPAIATVALVPICGTRHLFYLPLLGRARTARAAHRVLALALARVPVPKPRVPAVLLGECTCGLLWPSFEGWAANQRSCIVCSNQQVAAAQRQFKLLPAESFALVTTPAIPPAVRASSQSNAQDTDLTLGAEAADAPATTAEPAAREAIDDSSPMAGAAVPLPLPPSYTEALKARHEMVQKLRRSIRSESLTPQQRRELQYAVQAHFRVCVQCPKRCASTNVDFLLTCYAWLQEWLVTSGSIRQVSDLVRVFRDSSKDGGAAHQLMMMPQQGGHFHPVHVHHLRRKSSSSSLGSAFSGSASSGNAAAAASPAAAQ